MFISTRDEFVVSSFRSQISGGIYLDLIRMAEMERALHLQVHLYRSFYITTMKFYFPQVNITSNNPCL